jgi:UDP-glucose 4-epimerase
MEKNKNRYYSIANKKSYTIIEVAKLFGAKIKLLPPRMGERYASALSNLSLNNKVYKKYGNVDLKKYIQDFIKRHSKS